jgi:hypothetical protein
VTSRAAELALAGDAEVDEELAGAEHAHPASGNTSEAELGQLDGDSAADAELFAGLPSPEGTAGEAQIVDDLETDLVRDEADDGADPEDGMVRGTAAGEPVHELDDELTTAVDPSDQLSAEHDDIELEEEGRVDSQPDRSARTALEPDSGPSYGTHTELSAADHAHEAEMDW